MVKGSISGSGLETDFIQTLQTGIHKTIVTSLDEPGWEHMLEKATDELQRVESKTSPYAQSRARPVTLNVSPLFSSHLSANKCRIDSEQIFPSRTECESSLDEGIYQYVQKLPSSLQEELLDFVRYLLMKAEKKEKEEWISLSLSSAMRDMENEPALYGLADIKVMFS